MRTFFNPKNRNLFQNHKTIYIGNVLPQLVLKLDCTYCIFIAGFPTNYEICSPFLPQYGGVSTAPHTVARGSTSRITDYNPPQVQ